MEYAIKKYRPLKEIEYSLEKQMIKGFKGFINSLMGKKVMDKTNDPHEPSTKRNYFLAKYQQLLNNGKTGNVQVIKVETKNDHLIDKNNIVYLTFQLISDNGVRLFNSAAMATRDNVPKINTIIPIFYNPEDPSVVVLL